MLLNLLMLGESVEGQEISVKRFDLAVLGDDRERFITFEIVDTDEDEEGNAVVICNVFNEDKITRMKFDPLNFDPMEEANKFLAMEIDRFCGVYPIQNKNLYA